MHSLLLGNGINRVALQKEWLLILRELAHEFGADDLVQHLEGKPLSMFIEELSARSTGRFRDAEYRVKRAFARLLHQIDPIEAHRRICDPFRVIMTTNYDFTVEESLVGPLHSPAFLAAESRYSLFRRYQAGNKEVWHVHGDAARPASMVLGFDQYAGSLQKIRNYVMSGIDVSSLPYRLSSPVKSGILDFHLTRSVYSWVDHFLRDHVHIVGLGMDFTEIDLWWLLVHKRRRDHQSGLVFYYDIVLEGHVADTPVTSLLRSLGVEVVRVLANSYEKGYLNAADLIEERVARYPDLIPKPERRGEDSYSQTSRTARSRQQQANFSFPKANSG
ncbi:SIR2 family protein [Stutzerimonas degradans]